MLKPILLLSNGTFRQKSRNLLLLKTHLDGLTTEGLTNALNE